MGERELVSRYLHVPAARFLNSLPTLLSAGYLNRLLDEGPADARVAGVPVVPLNLGAAERGSSRHEVSVSRWGMRSRTGDKFRVKEKVRLDPETFSKG